MLYIQLGGLFFIFFLKEMCMMRLPFMRLIVTIANWIVTVVALNLGLVPVLGYNPLQATLEKIHMGNLFMPIHYVVGVAGIIALLGLLMGEDHCGE
jgi:uncharacterized membrane protein YuzA (DUF378 family)